HSQYQRDTQGAFHVRTAQQLSRQDNRQGHLTQHAMQWAYGGLRMGGRSYYALDLSQFSAQQPHRIQLQFHIDPERESVHHAQGSTHYPQLRHMGQSWSKPTVGYVYWQGKRRLVMAVGGGYDTGYEQSNYHQTNQQGAGIYLFDAMTGELLWWASANHRQSTSADVIAATDGDVHHLKYSVVSPIQAIDSNQDGVWDRLYFADLAGQAFRVQLSQSHQAQRPFTAMVQRILNEYRADGLSPRFYHAPSVSAHSNAQGQFLAVAWSSGDYSSLWAKSPVTAHDGVYVLHEPLAKGAISQNDTQALMPLQQLSEQNQSSSRGWFYRYASVAGEIKGIASPYVRQNRLYIPVYRQATASCEPTLGQSELLQLCMPWGVCGGLNATTLPALLPQQVQRITLGQGIWPLQWAMATHEQRLSISQQNGKNANAEFCKTPAGLGHAACLQLQPMAQLRILKWSQANGL
ncbi:MAG: PilC/PilY family type IV pilus protein, partial [Acinetobacter sp.]|nr:PilC/PilY family type IV pilus protein [Acinetobacter sp.]